VVVVVVVVVAAAAAAAVNLSRCLGCSAYVQRSSPC
jgi:hypothetical protein